jgi:hypothetical protein
MRMPFGETEGWVQGKDSELTGTSTTRCINERFFISNLDKYVS